MTDQGEFLGRLIRALADAGIPNMLTGSLSSSFHGKPRATNDIDIVISASEPQLLRLADVLGPDCYISVDAMREALGNRSMFNIIDQRSGWKADLILLKQRAFSLEEFRRRRSIEFMGVSTEIASAEDIILIKLEWSSMAESGRQYRDALGVASVQWDELDREYLRRWARELGVEALLEKLLQEAQTLQEP